jgi:hypothetical protein
MIRGNIAQRPGGIQSALLCTAVYQAIYVHAIQFSEDRPGMYQFEAQPEKTGRMLIRSWAFLLFVTIPTTAH